MSMCQVASANQCFSQLLLGGNHHRFIVACLIAIHAIKSLFDFLNRVPPFIQYNFFALRNQSLLAVSKEEKESIVIPKQIPEYLKIYVHLSTGVQSVTHFSILQVRRHYYDSYKNHYMLYHTCRAANDALFRRATLDFRL